MGETTDNRPNNQEGQSFTAREFELIQELVRSRMGKTRNYNMSALKDMSCHQEHSFPC